MKVVQKIYRCALCNAHFEIKSTRSPVHTAVDLKHILYGNIPSVHSMKDPLNWHERHECRAVAFLRDSFEVVGIGELVGYRVVEVPDRKPDKGSLKLVE